MPSKSLRILIADNQHFNRMKIERLFNQLDYFRVAPVQSLEELLNLVEYGCEPFDLLVINAGLAQGKLNLLDFCLDNEQLAHALIFDGKHAQLPIIAASERHKVQVSHALLPDLATIQRLMAIIDRPKPFVGTVISVR
ncbi:response regulator [Pseudomonas sp. WJP1]|uniref:response regulator n=1 Tax=Pseudomonas sp. WJP1 TaxID=2986947 RepID=UPI00234AA8DB|nr:response regulator [Pseudomonas sp. WJP1]WCM49862.1 response regulator [Pseudomonas sp. WJP1]